MLDSSFKVSRSLYWSVGLLLIAGIVLLSAVPFLTFILIVSTIAATGYLTISSVAESQGSELKRVKSDRDRLEQELSEYRSRQNLQTDLQRLQEEKEQTYQSLQALRAQQEDLSLRITRMRQENPELEALEERQRQSGALKTELLDLQGQLQAIREQVREYEARRHGLQAISNQYLQQEATLQQIREQVNAANQQLAEQETTKLTLQTHIQQLEEEKGEINQSLVSLRDQKAELQGRITRIREASSELEALEERRRQSGALKTHIEELEARRQALMEQIQRYESQREGLQGISNQYLQQESALQQLRDQINAANQQLAEAEAARQSHHHHCQNLQTDLQRLQEEKAEVNQSLVTLRDQEAELQRRISHIRQENPDLEALEERQRQSGALKTHIEELQGRLQAIKEQVQHYESQREGLQHISSQYLQQQEEFSQLKEQASTLNQQVAELELLRSTYDALSQNLSSLEDRKNVLEQEIPRLQQERDRVLIELREQEPKMQEIHHLQGQINDLKAGKRAQESRLIHLRNETEELEVKQTVLKSDNQRLDLEKERRSRELNEIQQAIREAKEDRQELENSTQLAFQALKVPVKPRALQPRGFNSESDFLNDFKGYLNQKGLVFPDRIIKAFHTALKVQDISALVILAGISGTGKSELPQAYAEFMGAPLVMLPVQPRWDSPQDLQGFYNYIEKKYKPTDLMRYLYQHQHDSTLRERMVMVLLDEMNLARVEYYFSDFLSKLEARRNGPTHLDLEAGSLRLDEADKKVLIPKQFLFVGTMNEDETTQSLSDKVLDRANVLTFGRPQELKLRKAETDIPAPQEYLTWANFQDWMVQTPDSFLVDQVKDYVDQANTIMENLGRPFAHRVYQAITKYVTNYPNAQESEDAWRQAIADQFGQKLLPKLRGVMVQDSAVESQLKSMKSLIGRLGDGALNTAFEKASEGQYGQFQWKGMIYPQE
jgi:chromosome segregation ATPase